MSSSHGGLLLLPYKAGKGRIAGRSCLARASVTAPLSRAISAACPLASTALPAPIACAALMQAEGTGQVREIFGEHRPFLFAQLQKLIRQARAGGLAARAKPARCLLLCSGSPHHWPPWPRLQQGLEQDGAGRDGWRQCRVVRLLRESDEAFGRSDAVRGESLRNRAKACSGREGVPRGCA